MEEFRKFLNDNGILKQFLQAVSDDRTCQHTEGSTLGNALTAYVTWYTASAVYPGITEDGWYTYYRAWQSVSPDGYIESRAWLIEQLTESKKLRLLNQIKYYR